MQERGCDGLSWFLMSDVPRTAEPTTADLDARRAARRYPDRPIVAVLAVVLRGDGSETRALIVQRAQQPNARRWGFPVGYWNSGRRSRRARCASSWKKPGSPPSRPVSST